MAHLTARQRLARVHPFVWIGAAAAIAGLVAWPLGGWDTVQLQSTKIPDVAAGQVVPGTMFDATVTSLEVTNVHPDGFSEPKEGWEYLILTATLDNDTRKTQDSVFLGGSGASPFTIDDGALGYGTTTLDSGGYEVSGDIYLVDDGTLNPDLQPGVPAPLIMVWEVPVGQWAAGDDVTVGVIDRVPHACTLSVGTCWGNAYLLANVALTIEQGEIAPPPDEDPFS